MHNRREVLALISSLVTAVATGQGSFASQEKQLGASQGVWPLSGAEQEAVQHCLELIRKRQLPNGALRMTVEENGWLEQYFALEGVLALLAAATPRSGEDLERVRNYLGWYARHIREPEGVAHNYQNHGAGYVEIKKTPENPDAKDFDSVDSYAGFYLLAVARYHRLAGATPAEIREGAVRSLRALEEIILNKERVVAASGGKVGITPEAARNGLPIARWDYSVHYLMDACEAFAGLHEAVGFFTAIGRKPEAQKSGLLADRIAAGAKAFSLADRFPLAVMNDNQPVPAKENSAPTLDDAGLANLFALAYLPPRYPKLWAQLKKHQPDSGNAPVAPVERWLIAAVRAAPNDVGEWRKRVVEETRSFGDRTYIGRPAMAVLALMDSSARFPEVRPSSRSSR